MKKYFNCAFAYAILAMVGGVFYREFTKALSFSGQTTLSVIHTHYFILGLFFFLVLLLLEKSFSFSTKKSDKILIAYHVGLNVLTSTLLIRGITQVLQTPLSKALDASLSGIAGIGHIILGVSLIMILLEVKKSIKNN